MASSRALVPMELEEVEQVVPGPETSEVEDFVPAALFYQQRQWHRRAMMFSSVALLALIIVSAAKVRPLYQRSPDTTHTEVKKSQDPHDKALQLWGNDLKYSCGSQVCDCAWAQKGSACANNAYSTACGSCCCRALYDDYSSSGSTSASTSNNNTLWIALGAGAACLLVAFVIWHAYTGEPIVIVAPPKPERRCCGA